MNLDYNQFYKLGGDKVFDNVLFLGGGTDVDADLYKQKKHPQAGTPDRPRDKWCVDEVLKARAQNKPVIGICRGSQFLGVYNGNKLHQHCMGETNGMTEIDAVTKYGNGGLNQHFFGQVTHHQTLDICMAGAKILAQSTHGQWAENHEAERYRIHTIPQVVFYPNTMHFGIQFHAEWMDKDSDACVWLRKMIKQTLGLEDIL
jgi:putative glutamine amidotransferase